MFHIYLDAEFDAIRYRDHFMQSVISIGAVMADDDLNEVDSFYMLVKPANFKHLSSMVKKITNLRDEQVYYAASLKDVVDMMLFWIKQHTSSLQDIICYSFGPDDRRTLMQNCRMLNIDDKGIFKHMIDLQKEISSSIRYEDAVISTTLSLDDLKAVYEMEGNVDHHALKDARDLKQIHTAYLQKKSVNAREIRRIVMYRKQRELEGIRKQQRQLKRMMEERFSSYPARWIDIHFCEDVIELFRLWSQRDHNFPLSWQNHKMYDEERSYHVADLYMRMRIVLDEIPCVLLYFTYKDEVFERSFPLTYRNATMIEMILKRMLV